MVAAKGKYELTCQGPLPPEREGESTCQAYVFIEQPRVVGELRLNQEDAFAGGEVRNQCEFDRHDRRARSWQCEPGEAEQVDVESVAK